MALAQKAPDQRIFGSTASSRSADDGSLAASAPRYSVGDTTGELSLPKINTSAAGIASSRAAGRINAASISRDEHDAYLTERSRLLDKFFAGTITRKEELRLEYVRWTLDRIEDAMTGADLDMLDSHVEIYENFAAEMQRFYEQVSHLAVKRR